MNKLSAKFHQYPVKILLLPFIGEAEVVDITTITIWVIINEVSIELQAYGKKTYTVIECLTLGN